MKGPTARAYVLHIIDSDSSNLDGFVFGFKHFAAETRFVISIFNFIFILERRWLGVVNLLDLRFVDSINLL